MKRWLAATAALVMICALALAQDKPADKNIGEAVLEGVSMEQAYGAALAAMVELGYRPLCGDRASGYLDFILICNQNGLDKNLPDGSVRGATILFVERSAGVVITARFRHGDKLNKAEDFFRDYCGALRAHLK